MTQILEYLKATVSNGASDLHLKHNMKPIFRIHSQLIDSEFEVLSPDELQAIVDEILPPHVVKLYREHHETDFSFFRKGVGRFRVNVFQSEGIPNFAFRHVKQQIPTFEELHLPAVMTKLASAARGIVLVSGTTGSGKSTTLASIVQYINFTERMRIITIEDPIEYTFEDQKSVISQREVGLDTETFNAALKHILRQDPDVIVIGEMRDERSFKTALASAETGHLVFSTLHTGTASAAIQRILQFYPNEEWDQARLALASNLYSIICQRLLRGAKDGVYPAVEVLFNTPTVKKLLEKNQLEVISAAIETGGEDGMMTFNQSIYKLIKSGSVTEEEGMAYATNPAALRMNLQGIFLDEGKRILGA